MAKKIIRLTESELINLVKRTARKILREGNDRRRNIFSLNVQNITDEDNNFDYHPLTAQTYYSEEDAIKAAQKLAKELSDSYDDVYCVSVMAGEYETPSGDVFGEPFDIYTISSKDKEITRRTRSDARFANPDVDDYSNGQSFDESIRRSIRKYLR